jgi:hypothetical protein
MKKEITIFILLSLCFLTYSQNEAEIYSRIYNLYIEKLKSPNIDYSFGATVTVLKQPIYMSKLDTNDYLGFRDKYKNLEKETFNNFIIENQSELHSERIKVKGIDIVMLENDSIPSWKDIISKYPNWIFSIIELSNIGFNEKADQALVYYGFDSGPGVGGGFYLVFEYRGRQWKCIRVIPGWAA